MKWHSVRDGKTEEGRRRKRGETKERPKEQVRETRVESKWRWGESRVNRRAENATKVRAGKDREGGEDAGRRAEGGGGEGEAKEDDLWLCVAR